VADAVPPSPMTARLKQAASALDAAVSFILILRDFRPVRGSLQGAYTPGAGA
jgi:hypothetical protein